VVKVDNFLFFTKVFGLEFCVNRKDGVDVRMEFKKVEIEE